MFLNFAHYKSAQQGVDTLQFEWKTQPPQPTDRFWPDGIMFNYHYSQLNEFSKQKSRLSAWLPLTFASAAVKLSACMSFPVCGVS